jgi:hypothetical protein
MGSRLRGVEGFGGRESDAGENSGLAFFRGGSSTWEVGEEVGVAKAVEGVDLEEEELKDTRLLRDMEWEEDGGGVGRDFCEDRIAGTLDEEDTEGAIELEVETRCTTVETVTRLDWAAGSRMESAGGRTR